MSKKYTGTFKDLTNVRFGKLLVLTRTKNTKGYKVFWDCKCDCGNLCSIWGNKLNRGETRTCGCRMTGYKTNRRNFIKNREYLRLKRRHKYKNFNVNDFFTYEEYQEKALMKCYYCGSAGSPKKDNRSTCVNKDRISKDVLILSGIDRIDSSLGYTKDNTVPCCHVCNSLKRDFELSSFYKIIKERFAHYGKILKNRGLV